MAHEHIIGMIDDYADSRLVTVASLKDHIRQETVISELLCGPKVSFICQREATVYSLDDYCDGRHSTDLRRFAFCPECGQRINWKDIKEGRA